MQASEYTYQISWNPAESAFIGRVAELVPIKAHGDSQEEVLELLKTSVESELTRCQEQGESVIEPFALTQYSGRFNIRIPPEFHRELAIAARLQGVALNQLIMSRLMHHRATPRNVESSSSSSVSEQDIVDAYIYPTRDTWIEGMLEKWKESGEKLLCFPFLRFRIRVLDQRANAEPFWMYMYYSMGATTHAHNSGLIEYRVRVIRWGETPDEATNVYRYRMNGDEKYWFVVDEFQRVRTQDNRLMALGDFRHVDSKRLSSTLRTSIAPVECLERVQIVETIAP